jgi:uncharacterized RDD family membrane protein YckC
MCNSTLGGKLLSIKVFNEDCTKEVPTIRLILRSTLILIVGLINLFNIGLMIYALSIILNLINLMLIIFTEKSQALHDIVAKTIVVKTIKIK